MKIQAIIGEEDKQDVNEEMEPAAKPGKQVSAQQETTEPE